MTAVLISRKGNQLILSAPDGGSLPMEVVAALDRKFHYSYKQMVTGREFRYTDIYLCHRDTTGWVWASYGLCDDIRDCLDKLKCEVQMCDITPPEENTLLLKPDWSQVADFQFRPRQRECLEAFAARHHGVIQAPVGFGKTTLLQAIVRMYPTARFHICTRSAAIANSIYTDMLRVTPSVGMVTGGREEYGKAITIITAASLKKSDGKADFFIFDECHQAAAPTYAKDIQTLYPYARMYGFSATPTGRSDGADMRVTELFGKVIFSMEYDEAKERGLVAPVKVHWLVNSSGYIHPDASKASQYRMGVWANDARNRLIAADVAARAGAEDQVLILTSTVEHAVRLGACLPDFTLVYGAMSPEECARYKKLNLLPEDYKPLSAKDRTRLKQEFRERKILRVISTDVWNTGVDFPSLQLVYNVSGRASKILTTQGAGRVSRIFAGKSNGEVVDVVDTFQRCGTGVYRNATARRKTYRAQGWDQEGWRV